MPMSNVSSEMGEKIQLGMICNRASYARRDDE